MGAITKRFRFTFDVEVSMTTPLEDFGETEDSQDETWLWWQGIQQRLQDALIADKEALMVVLKAKAAYEVADEAGKWHRNDNEMEQIEDEAVQQVIRHLGAEDREYFRDAEEKGYFAESTEPALYSSFHAYIVKMDITEVDQKPLG